MTSKKKPPKLANIEKKVKAAIESGNYVLTQHAFDRQQERMITLPETLYVLKNGHEEKRKSTFDVHKNVWKYAIRGKTKRDDHYIRIIIAFDEDEMMIITVMHIEENV